MSADLDNIESQIAQLQEQRESILRQQRDAKLREAKEIVHRFNITADELGLSAGRKRGGAAVKAKPEPKYANPNDPSQTWHGGKGPRPGWVKEFLANGGDLSNIEIRR